MADPFANCHVVAMPYPGRGHVNPMLNLCRLILNSRPDILVSFIVTEEWLGFLTASPPSTPLPPNFRFLSIPNVIPSEIGRGKDFPGFFEATLTKMEAPVEQLLDQLPPPTPSVIIYDTYLSWVVAVGNRRNIPVASLYTMSATVFSIFHHFDLILQNRQFSPNFSDQQEKEQIVNYIPGVPPIRTADLPTPLHGLAIPYFDVENATPVKPDYMKWLDAQPAGSVLYIAQGSFLSVSSAQLDEIIAGVRCTGIRFLWVGRGEHDGLEGNGIGNGLVLSWCDQLKVLCHPSVGGFWSHCGWNSTKEGAFAGVPMLTFPIFWDQVTNSKMIVDDWKMGLAVRKDDESVVTKDEVARIVLRLMDFESEEGKERRRRAKEIRDMCRSACAGGGLSETDILAFIRDISGC
ncbi:UDP-glycosyltransferase 87A2 [Sesamum alatum]|uniref:UDP-glycosyltransferase 87A2 n=1 Tax=Sesamum alatum TaxID=300844 RepID=A0AAE1XJB1_9LAMI|nr:UDP-glycosyltransferase 87A2 [Sesamum alatum]